VPDGWCWFVVREEYCWLVAGGWFVLREKYCWRVADKPSEQGAYKVRGKYEDRAAEVGKRPGRRCRIKGTGSSEVVPSTSEENSKMTRMLQ
jgi:hypothetical protein